MFGGRFGNEVAGISEVQETPKEGEVQFNKETLDWYDKLMGEDIGEIDTSLDKSSNLDEQQKSQIEPNEPPIPERNGEMDIAKSENRLPRNGGEWSGEQGNSMWKPDRNIEPGDRNGTNPEHKSWNEILDKHEIDGVKFNDGEPDFSEVGKGEVKITDFSDDRVSNFTQADEKLAEQRGTTPEEVRAWRKENGYTWHECKDCSTMQKVPTEIHGNIPHSGGVSAYKTQERIGEEVA